MRTLGLLLACAASLAAQTSPETAAGIRLFEAWLTEQMDYRGLPGVAVGVVHDQRLVWAKGFGLADLDKKTPVTEKTLFRMASNTKMFTAIAVLQLRDEGKLRLDDPVSKHLPWFRVKPSSEDDGPITVEHLITHGSGLPREAASPYWTSFKFPTTAEIRATVPAQAAAYGPDTRWKYSNLAVSLAGMVVEAVSHIPYEEYLRTRILQPLGMAATSLDKDVPGVAVGYGRRMPDRSRQPMAFMDTKGLGPAAGLTSNVEDMARFVSAQFRRGKASGILAFSTLREMHRVRMLENDWASGTGLGFQVNRAGGKVTVGHGGSLAGYKTQTSFRPAEKVGVIVLTNGDDSLPAKIAARAMEWIGEPLAKSAPEPKPRWDESWRRYAGLYRSIWGDLQVVDLVDSLALISPQAEDPKAGMQRLAPAAGGGFRLEGPTGGAAVGESVSFDERSGQVVSMKIGQSISGRVR